MLYHNIIEMDENITTLDCEIKFVKTHPDAKLPEKAHSTDNCFDVFAVEDTVIPAFGVEYEYPPGLPLGLQNYSQFKVPVINMGNAVVPIGLTVAYITPGFGFVVKPKSGLGFKHGLMVHAGEFDQNYRGDAGIKVYNTTSKPYTFKKGDKVAQIKVEKVWNTHITFTDVIDETDRGDGGFGSTGR